MGKWICQLNSAHVFDEPTVNYYCPICPKFQGPLKYFADSETPAIKMSTVQTPPPSTPVAKRTTIFEPPVEMEEPEVGLCVIMLDASSSMIDPAFADIPISRMTFIANSAAMGIFDLERMKNNPYAYVALFKFDHRVQLMFVDTIANIIQKYQTVEAFSDYLFKELNAMQGGTDLNKALDEAYMLVKKFVTKSLDSFPITKYTPVIQTVFRAGSTNSLAVPNIRVLVYTDGRQFVEGGSQTLNQNPFKQKPIPELQHDVLIGAFFGEPTAKGCQELKSIVSNCPIHNEPQFFLFNKASAVGEMNYLFRMASGASGFCPRCVNSKKA